MFVPRLRGNIVYSNFRQFEYDSVETLTTVLVPTQLSKGQFLGLNPCSTESVFGEFYTSTLREYDREAVGQVAEAPEVQTTLQIVDLSRTASLSSTDFVVRVH